MAEFPAFYQLGGCAAQRKQQRQRSTNWMTHHYCFNRRWFSHQSFPEFILPSQSSASGSKTSSFICRRLRSVGVGSNCTVKWAVRQLRNPLICAYSRLRRDMRTHLKTHYAKDKQTLPLSHVQLDKLCSCFECRCSLQRHLDLSIPSFYCTFAHYFMGLFWSSSALWHG